MKGRIVALGLPLLAACQAVPRDVDVAPIEDPRDRGSLAVEFEICMPARRVELRTIDVDVSSYLIALDKSFEQVPAERRNERLKSGLPPMSAPGRMSIRYAGGSLTAIDGLFQWNEVLKNEDGVLSAGPAFYEPSLFELTVSQQPVFRYWEPRYDVVTGISASSDTPDRGYEKYWFTPPPAATVPAQGFTAWQSPSSIENAAWLAQGSHRRFAAETWNPKGNERGFPVTDARTLPRIRYHLVTEHDHWHSNEAWNALLSWLPGLIQQQYSLDIASSDPRASAVDRLIRPQRTTIPACD